MERKLELTLNLRNEGEFEAVFYDHQSGDFIRYVCHDEITDNEVLRLIYEIVSWVQIMRDECLED